MEKKRGERERGEGEGERERERDGSSEKVEIQGIRVGRQEVGRGRKKERE